MDFTNMTTSDIEQLMLQNAIARQERLAKPDTKARDFAMAQAMSAPTRTGTFGESLSNIAGALGQYNTAEQARMASSDDAMQDILGMVYKQRMDLEEKKKALEASAKNRYQSVVSNELGLFNYDRDLGRYEMVMPGGQATKPYQEAYDKWLPIIKEQGSYTDDQDLQRQAHAAAIKQMNERFFAQGYDPTKSARTLPDVSGTTSIPIETNIPGNAPVSGKSFEDAEKDIGRRHNVNKSLLKLGKISKDDFNKRTDVLNAEYKRIGGLNASGITPPVEESKPAVKPTPIRTPQQVAIDTKEQEKAYEEGLKQHNEAQASLSTYAPTYSNIKDMEARSLAGMSSGAFVEPLQKLGNVISYIDPNASLAKYASNSEEYELHLMDLVKQNIKALGAGTAISNLDLLVTKMAAGGQGLTTQGRLMLLGAIKGAIEHQKLENQRKIKFFKDNKSMIGYEPFTEAQAMVAPVPSRGPNNTPMLRYEVINYDAFKDKLAKNHPEEAKKPDFDEVARHNFKRQAAMYREWISTGVDPRTKKVK